MHFHHFHTSVTPHPHTNAAQRRHFFRRTSAPSIPTSSQRPWSLVVARRPAEWQRNRLVRLHLRPQHRHHRASRHRLRHQPSTRCVRSWLRRFSGDSNASDWASKVDNSQRQIASLEAKLEEAAMNSRKHRWRDGTLKRARRGARRGASSGIRRRRRGRRCGACGRRWRGRSTA